MSFYRFIVFSVVFFGLAGCVSMPRVNTDFDTNASFSNLNSFAFAPDNAEAKEVTTLLSKRVRSALAASLKARGKSMVQESEADFWVAYHTSVEKRIDIDTYYQAWGMQPYWWYSPHYRSAHMPSTRVREYKIGTLVVDIIEAKSKSVIWSSSAENTLSKYLTPQEREEKIRLVVNAMLVEFPPQTLPAS